MAASTSRSPEDRALAKVRLARRLRRWTLVFALVVGVWAWIGYGARWVPAGMDTVPEIPPGSFCVVDKWQSTVRAGSHVFLALPDGPVVLSRVVRRDGDRIRIEHPNPDSAIPDSRTLGDLPVSSVVGTVLGAFTPDAGRGGG